MNRTTIQPQCRPPQERVCDRPELTVTTSVKERLHRLIDELPDDEDLGFGRGARPPLALRELLDELRRLGVDAGPDVRPAGQERDAQLLRAVLAQAPHLPVAAVDLLRQVGANAADVEAELLAVDGPPLDVKQVAAKLGISPGGVGRRAQQGPLLVLERAGKPDAYPAWQFTSTGRLPGLEKVLAALRVSPWAQAAWFLSGDARLGDRRPLDVPREGEVDAVLRAAAAYGEQGAA